VTSLQVPPDLKGVVRRLLAELDDLTLDPAHRDDMHEFSWGNVGVVTCWLMRDHAVDGRSHHVSVPTTLVLHRSSGDWKVALIHSNRVAA
jgi:ketosteroid isomerase-like protein